MLTWKILANSLLLYQTTFFQAQVMTAFKCSPEANTFDRNTAPLTFMDIISIFAVVEAQSLILPY